MISRAQCRGCTAALYAYNDAIRRGDRAGAWQALYDYDTHAEHRDVEA